MQYTFKPININVDSVDEITGVIPVLKDRVIEKRGHVISFTINQVEDNTRALQKTRKEIDAKMEHEMAKMVNIEGFHPFVKEMSKEDLFTAWMYQEAKAMAEMCDKKLKEIEKQLAEDEAEVKEIYSQIPELAKSEEVLAEVAEIINEK